MTEVKLDLAQLEAAMEQQINHLGLELICCEMQASPPTLRIYLDHENGIKLSDCERVSHQISDWLDTIDDKTISRYSLEVSSPGPDRPLKKPSHFKAAIGKNVRFWLLPGTTEHTRERGLITACSDSDVSIMSDRSEALHIPLSCIQKARLIPQTQEPELFHEK